MIGSDEVRGKNHDKAAAYGRLFIQTDKMQYFPGETITGSIYLSLVKEISSNQIFLRLKGKECFHIYEKDHIMSNHVILDPEKAAYTGPFQKGQFVFPFTFLLPTGIPGTFFQTGENFLANIMYYLEASIRPSGYDEPKLKYKHKFVVAHTENGNTNDSTESEVKTPITSCCFSSGYNILRVNNEKIFYMPGDVAQIRIELDNSKCSLNNKRIIMLLKQRLTLQGKSKPYVKDFGKVEREIQGVKARQVRENQLTAMNLMPLQDGDYWDIKLRGNMREELANIDHSSPSMNSTTKGKIITSEYYVEVFCEMDGKWTAHPKLSVPVEVRYPPSKDLIISWPPDWEPMIMKNVNFGLSLYEPNKGRMSSDVPSRDSNFQNRESDSPDQRMNMQTAPNRLTDNSSMPLTSDNGSGVVMSESNDE